MAINWKIKVESPVLTAGMSFQVRYRKLNSNIWNTLSPNPTTNEFTITNLENTDYEAEIKTVCSNGDLSKPIYHSTSSVTNVLSATIVWSDDTNNPKSGNNSSITVKEADINYNSNDPIINSEWQIFDGTSFIFYKNNTTGSENIVLSQINNKIRLKVTTQSGQIAYSNILEYTKTTNANIYITDVVSDAQSGTTTYKLHIENSPFSGYANTVATRGSNSKRLNADFSPYGNGIMISAATPIGQDVFASQQVEIPIGVYDCFINISIAPLYSGVETNGQGAISYGFTNDFFDGICQAEALYSDYNGEISY